LSPDAFDRLKICLKCVCGRGFTPDLIEGAHSVPPDPIAGFGAASRRGDGKGRGGKGKGRKTTERKSRGGQWKGRKGTGRETRGREGRGEEGMAEEGRAPETTYSR